MLDLSASGIASLKGSLTRSDDGCRHAQGARREFGRVGRRAGVDRQAQRGRARSTGSAVNVRAFLDTLRREGLFADAVSVLTHVLPRQYALAWGCECWLDGHAGTEPDPSDKSALAAAQRWLKEPTEEHRRAAFELADRLGYRTAAAWLLRPRAGLAAAFFRPASWRFRPTRSVGRSRVGRRDPDRRGGPGRFPRPHQCVHRSSARGIRPGVDLRLEP